jgi:hypothetical protein
MDYLINSAKISIKFSYTPGTARFAVYIDPSANDRATILIRICRH